MSNGVGTSDRAWSQWGNPIFSTSLRANGDCQLAGADSIMLAFGGEQSLLRRCLGMALKARCPLKETSWRKTVCRIPVHDRSTSSSISSSTFGLPVSKSTLRAARRPSWTEACRVRSGLDVWGTETYKELARGCDELELVEAGSSRATDLFLLSPHWRHPNAMIGSVPGCLASVSMVA
ncbi:hypothetical protein BGZ63DRAFT_276065 [Mariannaea sp. PMI_226]|nr:hypothetical protein BGZ63DRAFT_276065 [Mariannaea sp. PMI_226]